VKIRLIVLILGTVVLSTTQVSAITPSTDLLIARAARTSRWTADLYINNPGHTTVSVDIMWLERGQANPDPDPETVVVGPEVTLVLNDVLRELFGMNRTAGAIRIVSTGGAATANLIVFTGAGLEPTAVAAFAGGVTFTDTYPDGGEITWTVTFFLADNQGFWGSLNAVGSTFTGVDEGCNGQFPALLFEGGKAG